MPYQKGWKICNGCTGLWYLAEPKKFGGKCLNPAGHHDVGLFNDLFYDLYYFGGETERDLSGAVQENWRHCRKCLLLFFDGNSSSGLCHAGGGHDGVGSKNYILKHQRYLFQKGKRMFINWRWCCKCEQLCQPDWQVSLYSLCPFQKGASHDLTGSGFYALDETQLT